MSDTLSKRDLFKIGIELIICNGFIRNDEKVNELMEIYDTMIGIQLGTTFNYDKFREAFEVRKIGSGDENKTELIKKIAKQTGVSYGTINRLSKGAKLSIESILKVCKWINQPITDFVE